MNWSDISLEMVRRKRHRIYDLWRFIEEDLLQRGVPKDQICIGGTDSMTDENCFSYRREHGKTGRMALFGMLEKR